jgi:hypothetical protein
MGGLSLYFGTVCPVACAAQSFRVRWGRGLHLGGMGPEARVGVVSPVTTEKIKKAQKTPPPTSKFQKIPRKKQKDPYKGSTFCAILSLQALKGRNLQWLKVK